MKIVKASIAFITFFALLSFHKGGEAALEEVTSSQTMTICFSDLGAIPNGYRIISAIYSPDCPSVPGAPFNAVVIGRR